MKTKIFLFFTLLILSCSYANSNDAKSGNVFVPDGSIEVIASPDLYNLTLKWAGEFCTLNPKVTIHVLPTSAKNLDELITSGNGIGFFSQETYPKRAESIWNMVVGRDVIVPVINAKNPLFNQIYQSGITAEELTRIVKNSENRNWGTISGGLQSLPIQYVASDDQSIQAALVEYLNLNQTDLNGANLLTGNDLIAEIQKDPNAMGFCKLVQITDLNNQSLFADLRILPIDKNGNGKLDYVENIYEDLQSFSRGVWIGKYPKALASNIYSVMAEKPENTNEVAFLKWVLTDGQQYLGSNGYCDLFYTERLTQLAKFDSPAAYASLPISSTNTFMGYMLLILVFIIMAGIVINQFVQHSKKNNRFEIPIGAQNNGAFDENSIKIPNGLFFDKTHTWAFRRRNGSVKVGIDDFIQHVTGKITRVEVKNVGDRVKKGEILFSLIHKGKLLNIYSPISGKIVENNENLTTDSSLLNSAPYDAGWVYIIEPANWGLEIQYLMLAEKYKEGLTDEFKKLKDFFANLLNVKSPELAYVVLQDGGALKDHVLADLGPEVWEEFQTEFIDKAK